MFVPTSVILGRWQNDQHTLNTTDAVMTVGQQTGLLIIFGRPPWWGRVIISAAFFRLFVHLLPSIYIVVYFISICCSWLLVLTGELALFMLFPPSFMCNFLLPHHSMPSRISLYPDRFCPNFQLPYALFLLLLACLGWLLFWWWAESI